MSEQLKYYIVVMEEFDKGKEFPWRTEHKGLFKSYRDASTYLIEKEMFDVFPYYNELWEDFDLDPYELHYQIGNFDGECHIAYIEEWKVLH